MTISVPRFSASSPQTEPLTLAEARAWLRVDSEDEDVLISSLISSAREIVEHESGIMAVKRTVTEYLDAWPEGSCIELTAGPVVSVSAVDYIASGASTFSTFGSTLYSVDSISSIGRVVLKSTESWPDTATLPNCVRITYVAGHEYGSVPQPLLHSLRLQLGTLYEQREDSPVGGKSGYNLRASEALARRMRQRWV